MRSIISIILIICAVFIVFEFILACVSYKNREKIIAFFKRKKTWSIAGILMALIASIPVMVIVLYAIITPVLMLIRGDCFAGYYTSYQSKLYYEGNNYYRVTDEERIDMVREYADNQWIDTQRFITGAPVEFPYLEYWSSPFLNDDLYLPEGKEPIYLKVGTLGGTTYYIQE